MREGRRVSEVGEEGVEGEGEEGALFAGHGIFVSGCVSGPGVGRDESRGRGLGEREGGYERASTRRGSRDLSGTSA